MKGYRCPVCKKSLSKHEYESALGLLSERESHYAKHQKELKEKLRKAQAAQAKARQAGITFERARSNRLMAGQTKTISKLQERISQLEKGTTPQTDGLEFEHKLVARLEREFPKDDIKHKGQGGDILHSVKFNGAIAGTIIYECKRCPRINSSHVQQTHLAKQSRNAHFAVLVTTGVRKGFSGLCLDRGVLVVSPLGTIALASLLRDHLIEMMRSNVALERRASIANELLNFISSPDFKNPIENVVRTCSELQGMLHDEIKGHSRTWRKRWDHYQVVQWSASQIQANVRLVLHGEKPKLPRREIAPLQLAASVGKN
jgi:hypothetical protein